MNTENVTNSKNELDGNILPSILRVKSEKEIYESIKTAIQEGNISDEGLLRFYIATYKLNKVNELIKEDSELKAIVDNLAIQFKNLSYDGKLISHGATYTKKVLNNPVEDCKNIVLEAFKNLDKVSEIQKTLPEGTTVTINLDTIDLANVLIEKGNELKEMHDVAMDLEAPIKYQTFGIKLRNAKK